jgi:branched-chain amino acid transport system permease protein
VAETYVVSLFTLVVITSLLASSVNLLAGEVGLVSMGHAGISATAGYAVAWGTRHGLDLPRQLALALALTVLISVLYGLTVMRTNGLVFLMITLALGMVVFGLAYKWSAVTGGQSGLAGARRPVLVREPHEFYYLCLGVLAITLAGLSVFSRSALGLSFRGVRDSETRMASLGYSTVAIKFVAVVMSGVIAGGSGVLAVWHSQFISPTTASFERSAMAVVIVIIGGTGLLIGPILGSALVIAIEHWLSSYVEAWPALLGALFIAVVIFCPQGVAGLVRAGGPRPVALRAVGARPGHNPAPVPATAGQGTESKRSQREDESTWRETSG